MNNQYDLNLGWYEMMDRVAMIQNQLEDNVYNHCEADLNVQAMIDIIQDELNGLYSYCSGKLYK